MVPGLFCGHQLASFAWQARSLFVALPHLAPHTCVASSSWISEPHTWCEAIHQTARCSETAQESSYTQEWLCNGDILFPMITWVSPNVAMAWLFQHLEPENLIYRNNQSLLVPAWGRLRQEAVVNSRLAWHLYLVSSRISGARVRLCLQRKIKWKWVTNKYQIKIYSKPILPK